MASVLSGAGTFLYEEEWRETLQQQLDEPSVWKEICDVEFTNSHTINNPYHTDTAVVTLERGSPYVYNTISQTNQSVAITVDRAVPEFIPRPTLAQSTYASIAQLARRQAVTLDEAIEAYIYTQHATNFTDFDNASIGGAAGSITVSATNVDDIMRALIREIQQASGQKMLEKNGAFIVWKPSHFESLVAFAQANGYNMADQWLRDGSNKAKGIYYSGIWHYTTNLGLSGRIVGGIRKAIFVGVLADTYGNIMIDEKDPGLRSGVGVVSSVTFGVTVWNNLIPVVFDMAVTGAS